MLLYAFRTFIILLCIGNCFGAYGLLAGQADIVAKFPKLTFEWLTFLTTVPVINLIGLGGLWFWQSWAACLVILSGLVVAIADIYFGINYHLFVAVPSLLTLCFFIFKFWPNFN